MIGLRRQRKYRVTAGTGSHTTEVTQSAPIEDTWYLLKTQTITASERRVWNLKNISADFGGTVDPTLGRVVVALGVKVSGIHTAVEGVRSKAFNEGTAPVTQCGAAATEEKTSWNNSTMGGVPLPRVYPENTEITIEYYLKWFREGGTGTCTALCIGHVNNLRDAMLISLRGGT